MKKADIEAKAAEMGVDLSLPHARRYIVAVLEGERSEPDPYPREPRDASGFTEDFSALVIRE